MSYHYIYEPQALTEYKQALTEYKEAISWYLDRSETAANNFVKEIKRKDCNDLYRSFALPQ